MAKLIYQQIYEYLMELIHKYKDYPNYKLPSESQLARKFSASRISVRNALLRLENKQYIERIQGKGSFIAPNIQFGVSAKKSENIALIIPNIGTRFADNLITGISEFCDQNSLNLIILKSFDDLNKEIRLIKSLSGMNVKGLIIFPSKQADFNEEILKLSMMRFPLVTIDRIIKNINIASISTDHHNSMYTAVKLLTEKNYKNICLIAEETEVSSVLERIQGFHDGLLDFVGEIKKHNLFKIKENKQEVITKILKDFLIQNSEIDAVIINGDTYALGIIEAAASLNISIPDKLRLVIYDTEFIDIESILKIKPYMIVQDSVNIGLNAAKALYQQMFGNLKIVTERLKASIMECITD